MTGAIPRDRLQPALLDRLVDHDPRSSVESTDARAITRQRLRQCVLRDLGWLLNAQAGLASRLDRTRYARVLKSTLNFGMPPLSGMLVSDIEAADLERAIRGAILAFEPRILAHTLTVTAVPGVDALAHHNVLVFEITGQLWAQPYPLELLLKTSLDLETGLVEVRDERAARFGHDEAAGASGAPTGGVMPGTTTGSTAGATAGAPAGAAADVATPDRG